MMYNTIVCMRRASAGLAGRKTAHRQEPPAMQNDWKG